MRTIERSDLPHVQGLSRGLAILHAINLSPEGWASIADLSAMTGLHRTTVRRLLETLQAEGYVRRSVPPTTATG
jgi:IclR family mhp operon transcriptional activator